jgi:TolA-binding protein
MLMKRIDRIAARAVATARALSLVIVASSALLAISQTAIAQGGGAGGGGPIDAAERSYLSANGLLNRGMNDLAAAEYRKFIEEHPRHAKIPVARYGLGVALYRLKNYKDAAEALAPLEERDDFEFAAEALFLLGQSRLELKQYEQAAAPLMSVVGNHKDHDLADDAAALLAESLYRAERYADVEAPWQAMTRNWPESAQRERVELLQGLALIALKKDADAARHFARAQERFGEDGEFATRMALLRAQALHRSGELEEAARQYQTVLDADGGPGEHLADALLGLGTLRQAQNDGSAVPSGRSRARHGRAGDDRARPVVAGGG